MNLDGLIGGAARLFCQRVMQLPQTPGGFELPAPDPDKTYLLYLHIPFCVVLCPFCSFHRVQFKEQGALAYFERLRREIRLVSDRGYRFDELYVGGGTPTVLPDELRLTIELVRELHDVGPISVETNPDDLATDSVRHLCDAGVNRISVGVQSFDDQLLREMQRYEKYGSSEEIREHLKRTKGIFDTSNVDMIFNFPHQTEASLRRDLDMLIDDIGVDQVSFYPLMAAENTRETMREHMGQVGYSRERQFYELIAARMLAAGYVRISAWCFSRRPGMGDEYIIDREDYLGLGSGAFSYLGGTLIASPFSISRYKQLIDDGKFGGTRGRAMSVRDQMRYYLLMQLFGGSLDTARAELRFDGDFRRTIRGELAALKALGAIKDSGTSLTLTESGYYLWVILMREFFSGINNLREQLKKRSPAAA